MSDGPWHGWYHVMGHTYGSWLYGDPRGFRTRHHREHVEGDYKNPPPPGSYENLEQCSRASLKQAPVVIPTNLEQLWAWPSSTAWKDWELWSFACPFPDSIVMFWPSCLSANHAIGWERRNVMLG